MKVFFKCIYLKISSAIYPLFFSVTTTSNTAANYTADAANDNVLFCVRELKGNNIPNIKKYFKFVSLSRKVVAEMTSLGQVTVGN